MKSFSFAIIAGILIATTGCSQLVNKPTPPVAEKPVVRAAVIGGMTMTHLWDKITTEFKKDTGYTVETIATGEKPLLAKTMADGKVDLLTMHSGDITTNVVASGYAVNMRPWAHNDLVIAGPASDPAGIKGMKSGVEAFKKIAKAKANWVDFRGNGPREMCHGLWKRAGVVPEGTWVIKDESNSTHNVLEFAASKNAYVVVGRMPILFGKKTAAGMEIMVEGDPAMQRPYIVMEANPERFPNANTRGARMLADYLLSEKVQELLANFGVEEYGMPLFHPLKSLQAELEDGREKPQTAEK